MRLIYGCDASVIELVERLTDTNRLAPAVGIGVINKDGLLVAGVLYNEYRGNDIRMHVAATTKRWATRKILSSLLSYPFHQLGVRRITGIVDIKNTNAQQFDERIGFKKEGILRKAGSTGEDMIMYGLLKEEFLNSKYSL